MVYGEKLLSKNILGRFMGKIVVKTDGSSFGNPGYAGAGVEIVGPKHLLASKPLGIATNNAAEYEAVIFALELLSKYKLFSRKIVIETDSQLLVKQVSKEYSVKSEVIKPLYEKMNLLIGMFDDLEIKYIPREQNHIADFLARTGSNESRRRATGQKWWLHSS